jgi:hypothetical protein
MECDSRRSGGGPSVYKNFGQVFCPVDSLSLGIYRAFLAFWRTIELAPLFGMACATAAKLAGSPIRLNTDKM